MNGIGLCQGNFALITDDLPGVIDLVGFFKTLNLIGFDGPGVVEPFNEELKEIARQDPATTTKKTADALNGVWKEAGLS